jgi:hypothetical protein
MNTPRCIPDGRAKPIDALSAGSTWLVGSSRLFSGKWQFAGTAEAALSFEFFNTKCSWSLKATTAQRQV